MESLYEKEMQDPEFAKLMAKESFILETTEKIIELMQKEKITKADLAKMLEKSEDYITQLLDGVLPIGHYKYWREMPMLTKPVDPPCPL